MHVFLSKLLDNFSCIVHDLHNYNFFFAFFCLFVFAVGYVEELRKLVFTMPTAELKAVSEKYSTQAPEALRKLLNSIMREKRG